MGGESQLERVIDNFLSWSTHAAPSRYGSGSSPSSTGVARSGVG
jgi:hypothetical protein